jgi:sulfatase modifying factor 1
VTLEPAMAAIPAGEFLMGKDNSRPDEGPAHRVRVAAFRAALLPVTNTDYTQFARSTSATPPPFTSEEKFTDPGQPVVGVNWHEANAYCAWLSKETGTDFRLPTEAEREYAARGGLTEGDWPWAGPNEAFVAWVNSLAAPHAPTPDCANGFGLRCMAENVHEWCSDWYSTTYYAESPRDNPTGPPAGVRRASRGGSWRHREKTTRLNARSSLVPEFRYSDFGFRVYADG